MTTMCEIHDVDAGQDCDSLATTTVSYVPQYLQAQYEQAKKTGDTSGYLSTALVCESCAAALREEV